MKKNVLITGASGFIGTHLRSLLRNSHTINPIALFKEDNNLIDGQISIKESIDSVVHLAGLSFVPDAIKNPYKMYHSNFMFTLNILDYCRRENIKEFIFMSSYIYGKPEYLPINEAHPTNIENPYGRSKLMCEEICKAYSEEYGIKLVILRPFNIFGHNQDKRFLIPTIIQQIKENKDHIVLKDLKPKRDYLYVKDLVSLLELIIKKKKVKSLSSYNIGSGVSHSVEGIAKKILEVFQCDKQIKDLGDIRQNEVLDCIADIKNIKNDYDWFPRYSFEEGIEDMRLESDKDV